MEGIPEEQVKRSCRDEEAEGVETPVWKPTNLKRSLRGIKLHAVAETWKFLEETAGHRGHCMTFSGITDTRLSVSNTVFYSD